MGVNKERKREYAKERYQRIKHSEKYKTGRREYAKKRYHENKDNPEFIKKRNERARRHYYKNVEKSREDARIRTRRYRIRHNIPIPQWTKRTLQWKCDSPNFKPSLITKTGTFTLRFD